jgi:uncharacterized protein YutE (UPF0331/DUF86 family)
MLEAETSIQNLNELSSLPEEEFLKNKHYVASAKYNLLIAIEACIDIAYHIISKNRMRLPRDYADSFKVLMENNVISEDLGKRLMLMARFRNRLVHIYWDVDDKMVYQYIRENISDIEEFLKKMRELLFG